MLVLPEQELQVLKVRNPLVRFCLLVLEEDLMGAVKCIKKLSNDELCCGLKFVAKKYGKLPKEYYSFLYKLPVSLQLTLDLLSEEEIIPIVQNQCVPTQVLIRLCYNFAVNGHDAEVTKLIHTLMENGNMKQAIELVDYVKDVKEKAGIFAKCGRYGEAYLFAKASGDTSLIDEMKELMISKFKTQ